MRSKYLLATVFAVVVVAVPSADALRQDVTLRHKWTKGETLRYRMTQKAMSTISGLPGDMGEMTVEQTVTQVLKETVDDIAADGTTTLRATFESINVDMSTPMGRMAYDTAHPETASDPGSMLKNIFGNMIGESFTTVVTPAGAVQRVEGLSKLSDKMFASLPAEAAPMLGGLRQGLSDDAMKLNMAQAFAKFPERPLKTGETWDDQVTSINPMMGPVTVSSTSTLKAIEGAGDKQVARIVSTLTLRQDSATPGAGPMGMTVKMDEAKGDREVLFSIAQGHMQKVTTNLAMPMSISGTAPDGTALNMRSATRSTTTLELLQP
jgi:Family of unknown function (DUF6263)